MGAADRRVPRLLHPGAWWVWALGVAAAASQTTNPVLLGLLVAVATVVVMARRPDAPHAASFRAFLLLGVFVVVMRMLVQVVVGSPVPGGTVVLTLPEVTLPEWAAGVRIGGEVTLEGLVLALYQGLQLLAVLAAIGAANALADARRLVRTIPGALYEAGVAVVVALSFAPRLVEDTVRVRRALRLRGREVGAVRGVGHVAAPVLEGALDSSLELAAAMDSRGFGRRATVPQGWRAASSAMVVVGLLGVLAGVYGLMAGSSTPLTGTGVLLGGSLAALFGMTLAGKHSIRTRYRPDPWETPEWLVAAGGLLPAAVYGWAAAQPLDGMNMLVVPLLAPEVPLAAVLASLVAATPAIAAPPLPSWARGTAVEPPEPAARNEHVAAAPGAAS